MGMLSTTVRRSLRAVRKARTTSASALAAEWTRSGTAPPERARPGWSMAKFERTAEAVASAASTMSGVRDLAASTMPVVAFVSPQPWWTDSRPTRPDMRAYPSAIIAAPPA
jgi:hypothetical protein